MTALEFKKARRITVDQRDGSLWLGDLFGRLTPAEMREDAKRLGKSLRSAQEYKQTARMCTPPVRERLAATRVHVSYTILRTGARADKFKVPHDESYRILLGLIEEAERSGHDFVDPAGYLIAIGLGPRVEDLFGPDGADDEFRVFLAETAPGPARDRLYRSLAAQQSERAVLHRAVAQVVQDEKAARRKLQEEQGRRGPCPDPARLEETEFARGVCAIAKSVHSLNQRFGHLAPTALRDERNQSAVDFAQAKIGVFVAWLAGTLETGAESEAAIPAQRGQRRTPVAA